MYKLPTLNPARNFNAIAVLTSGGDSPGMNPAIRAVVRSALHAGIRVYGVQRGYSGLIIGDMAELHSEDVRNIVQRGGTVLKSDRCTAFRDPLVRKQAATILQEKGIDGLIVIGGDGSLTGAHLLTVEQGIPVIGLPGTIDNDIYGTDDTIGFDTAVATALEAIDRIRDTALSHDTLFLVEVMGRNSGFIATQVGLACGAEMIVVPDFDIQVENICFQLAADRNAGRGSSGIIVVAEGQHPGLTYRLAEQLNQHGQNAKVCILGHIQRGGSPSGHDRVLASCLGAAAINALRNGHSNCMVGVERGEIVNIPLEHVVNRNKPLNPQMVELVNTLHR